MMCALPNMSLGIYNNNNNLYLFILEVSKYEIKQLVYYIAVSIIVLYAILLINIKNAVLTCISAIKGVNPGEDGGDISPPCFDMGGGITCLLSPPCFAPQSCCFFVLEN